MNLTDIEKWLTTDDSLICGASHGLAKQFGWSVLWTRVLTLVAILMSPSIGLIGYFVTAIIMTQKKSRY
ncbi:PspC domain-containing protein [Shewanella sp. UCD-KL21]|uniref:PspC domain-containing protein n=1 Tax=Shewanella sp. UCD-KL21 TaxID=1917164 RepID=UPI00097103F5|nr:PspC domain-containing protein [Shewanella sp. UCD-KL21]